MNPWYVLGIELLTLAALFIGLVILLIMLIFAKRRKRPLRTKGILLSVDIVLATCAILFISSHPTYYKFNDRDIIGSDIGAISEKYGAFDIGSAEDGRAGRVAYYIYTDNGPIMPDHMEHYYWIYFDENGTIYRVEDNVRPGG